MSKEEDSFPAGAALAGMLAAVAMIGWVAFHMAAGVQTIYDARPMKSDGELCKERGGEWVQPYRSAGKCFSKEVFK